MQKKTGGQAGRRAGRSSSLPTVYVWVAGGGQRAAVGGRWRRAGKGALRVVGEARLALQLSPT